MILLRADPPAHSSKLARHEGGHEHWERRPHNGLGHLVGRVDSDDAGPSRALRGHATLLHPRHDRLDDQGLNRISDLRACQGAPRTTMPAADSKAWGSRNPKGPPGFRQ